MNSTLTNKFMEVLDKVKIGCIINQKTKRKQHGYNSR